MFFCGNFSDIILSERNIGFKFRISLFVATDDFQKCIFRNNLTVYRLDFFIGKQSEFYRIDFFIISNIEYFVLFQNFQQIDFCFLSLVFHRNMDGNQFFLLTTINKFCLNIFTVEFHSVRSGFF